MSEERKKLLWISVSACVFGLVLIGTGFFLFAPRSGGAAAPATIGNVAAPKPLYPQDYLSAPLPLENPTTTTIGPDGAPIVVYGDPLTPAEGAALSPAGTLPAAPEPAGQKPESAPSASKAPAAKAPAASEAAPKKAPVLAKVQSPAKAAPPAKIADYWIQAASFTSRGRADDLKQALSEKGIATFISVKDIVGKSWYRVRVGPYATKAEAEGWMGRLKAMPQCAEAYVSKGN